MPRFRKEKASKMKMKIGLGIGKNLGRSFQVIGFLRADFRESGLDYGKRFLTGFTALKKGKNLRIFNVRTFKYFRNPKKIEKRWV